MDLAADLGIRPGDGGHADVGAHVGDPLRFGEQIQKLRACQDGAFAGAQALQMMVLQGVYHVVHHFLQGFDVAGRLDIPLLKCLAAVVQDPVQELLQHVDLRLGRLREGGLVLGQGGADLRDIHGVVAETLEFRGGGVIVVHDLQMAGSRQVGGKLDQVIADPVGHVVDIFLVLDDLFRVFFLVVGEGIEGTADIFHGHVVHHKERVIAAPEGQGRRAEKDGAEGLQKLVLLGNGYRLVLDQPAADPLAKI